MAAKTTYIGNCPICNLPAEYPGNGVELIKTKRRSFITMHTECYLHEKEVNNVKRFNHNLSK